MIFNLWNLLLYKLSIILSHGSGENSVVRPQSSLHRSLDRIDVAAAQHQINDPTEFDQSKPWASKAIVRN